MSLGSKPQSKGRPVQRAGLSGRVPTARFCGVRGRASFNDVIALSVIAAYVWLASPVCTILLPSTPLHTAPAPPPLPRLLLPHSSAAPSLPPVCTILLPSSPPPPYPALQAPAFSFLTFLLLLLWPWYMIPPSTVQVSLSGTSLHSPSLAFRHLSPHSKPRFPAPSSTVQASLSGTFLHTPSLAFRHLPPHSSSFSGTPSTAKASLSDTFLHSTSLAF